jgi:molybdate transport system ATP-binding protein
MADAVAATGLYARLVKRVGAFELDTEVTARPGEPTALLGPSGSGKSTCVRLLAGLLRPDAGSIRVGTALWFDADSGVALPPQRRGVGVVFQHYALFPHLSAAENVMFGLRRLGIGRRPAHERAICVLEQFGVRELADRRPAQLSGGQQQRVALARALALRPQLLLLDEPLAALDALTREQVRGELRRTLAGLHIPVVLVTHDPIDALALTTRVRVLERGRTTQEGPAEELVRRPRSPFVATLLGVNFLRGTAVCAGDGVVRIQTGRASVFAAGTTAGEVHAAIYPWDITLHTRRPEGSARNVFAACVADVTPLGRAIRVALRGPLPLVAEVTPAAAAEMGLAVGVETWASFKALSVAVYE